MARAKQKVEQGRNERKVLQQRLFGREGEERSHAVAILLIAQADAPEEPTREEEQEGEGRGGRQALTPAQKQAEAKE